MPIWDYKCPLCEKVDEDVLVDIAPSPHRCMDCKATMDRMPATSSFVVKGYAAKNGYSYKNSWMQKGQG